jgi:hypothetical protein
VHVNVEIHRGPGPWRAARAEADRLVIVAWVQFAGFLAWSAFLALYVWFIIGLDRGALACFDGDTPACSVPAATSLAPLVVPAVAWSLVIVLATAAVVVTHRHRRGAASLTAALVTLAAAPAAAFAAGSLAGVPLLFSF